jgi:hypothetical protein
VDFAEPWLTGFRMVQVIGPDGFKPAGDTVIVSFPDFRNRRRAAEVPRLS